MKTYSYLKGSAFHDDAEVYFTPFMLLACITLDLMDKDRSLMPPEDCSLCHIKRIFEEPFKQVSSQALLPGTRDGNMKNPSFLL